MELLFLGGLGLMFALLMASAGQDRPTATQIIYVPVEQPRSQTGGFLSVVIFFLLIIFVAGAFS